MWIVVLRVKLIPTERNGSWQDGALWYKRKPVPADRQESGEAADKRLECIPCIFRGYLSFAVTAVLHLITPGYLSLIFSQSANPRFSLVLAC